MDNNTLYLLILIIVIALVIIVLFLRGQPASASANQLPEQPQLSPTVIYNTPPVVYGYGDRLRGHPRWHPRWRRRLI
jgi:hypothetical protein